MVGIDSEFGFLCTVFRPSSDLFAFDTEVDDESHDLDVVVVEDW